MTVDLAAEGQAPGTARRDRDSAYALHSAPMPQVIVTAVGPDKPGIVGELTACAYEEGANIADSRMVNLRGQFALLLLAEGSEAVLAKTRERLAAAAERLGLVLQHVACNAKPSIPPGGSPYTVKTYSVDRPGIVYRVTSALRNQGVNIEELETRLESAPFAGSPIFKMNIRVTVPKGVRSSELRATLEGIADELSCDIDLDAVESEAAR